MWILGPRVTIYGSGGCLKELQGFFFGGEGVGGGAFVVARSLVACLACLPACLPASVPACLPEDVFVDTLCVFVLSTAAMIEVVRTCFVERRLKLSVFFFFFFFFCLQDSILPCFLVC